MLPGGDSRAASCGTLVYSSTRSTDVMWFSSSAVCRMPHCRDPVKLIACVMTSPTLPPKASANSRQIDASPTWHDGVWAFTVIAVDDQQTERQNTYVDETDHVQRKTERFAGRNEQIPRRRVQILNVLSGTIALYDDVVIVRHKQCYRPDGGRIPRRVCLPLRTPESLSALEATRSNVRTRDFWLKRIFKRQTCACYTTYSPNRIAIGAIIHVVYRPRRLLTPSRRLTLRDVDR